MSNSLLKEFRFKIGEQYELNEFNLKSLESTFSNGLEYENYEYIKGDFKTLFGIPFSRNVILQYNGDILCRVTYRFVLEDLDNLFQELNNYLTLDKKLIREKLDLGKTFTIFRFKEFNLSLNIARDLELSAFKFLG
ncbi:hypothetical protein U8527_00475 [Kordia algicida OT-1]|uniref:Uncharacterized protein n=1 Tax=Kordia algicida OT-1 TaxID=391587 RepID=A9DRA3_9FLAO|nr:hypothetical protein [Kordia algicida]EDP96764.1 hypothetical protein KAOT1_16413 [Kordia algicida OT-1]